MDYTARVTELVGNKPSLREGKRQPSYYQDFVNQKYFYAVVIFMKKTKNGI